VLSGVPLGGQGWLQVGELAIIALAFSAVTDRLPRSATAVSSLRIRYLDGRGALRRLFQTVTSQGFTIDEVFTDTAARRSGSHPGPAARDGKSIVEVAIQVHGRQPVNDLAAVLSEIDDVDAVLVNDANIVHE
jgi:putative Mg2+ transporter-C (MgtC) family protein